MLIYQGVLLMEEIRNNHLGCIKPCNKNHVIVINYQPQLVQDFFSREKKADHDVCRTPSELWHIFLITIPGVSYCFFPYGNILNIYFPVKMYSSLISLDSNYPYNILGHQHGYSFLPSWWLVENGKLFEVGNNPIGDVPPFFYWTIKLLLMDKIRLTTKDDDYLIILGQIIIFHQPNFPWNKKISLTKPPFGVAIIWPELFTTGFLWPSQTVGWPSAFWSAKVLRG